jgi:hypothetical protein
MVTKYFSDPVVNSQKKKQNGFIDTRKKKDHGNFFTLFTNLFSFEIPKTARRFTLLLQNELVN